MSNREFLQLQMAAMTSEWFKNMVKEILRIERTPTHTELGYLWKESGRAERFRNYFKPFLTRTV